MHLSQTHFTNQIIELAGLEDAKPAPTPLPKAHCLYEKREDDEDHERSEMESVPYRAILGSLLYLSNCSRPDIATAVSMLAKFQATPSMRHWKAKKNVCRYLRGTINYGIKYRQNGIKRVLTAWTDADWARDQ